MQQDAPLPVSADVSIRNYDRVNDITELETLLDRIIASGNVFGFDIETGYH